MTCQECDRPVDDCRCPDMDQRLWRLIRKGTRWVRIACAVAMLNRRAKKTGFLKPELN